MSVKGAKQRKRLAKCFMSWTSGLPIKTFLRVRLSFHSFKTYLWVKLSFNSIALFIFGKRGEDSRGPDGLSTECAGCTEVSPSTIVESLFSMKLMRLVKGDRGWEPGNLLVTVALSRTGFLSNLWSSPCPTERSPFPPDIWNWIDAVFLPFSFPFCWLSVDATDGLVFFSSFLRKENQFFHMVTASHKVKPRTSVVVQNPRFTTGSKVLFCVYLHETSKTKTICFEDLWLRYNSCGKKSPCWETNLIADTTH